MPTLKNATHVQEIRHKKSKTPFPLFPLNQIALAAEPDCIQRPQAFPYTPLYLLMTPDPSAFFVSNQTPGKRTKFTSTHHFDSPASLQSSPHPAEPRYSPSAAATPLFSFPRFEPPLSHPSSPNFTSPSSSPHPPLSPMSLYNEHQATPTACLPDQESTRQHEVQLERVRCLLTCAQLLSPPLGISRHEIQVPQLVSRLLKVKNVAERGEGEGVESERVKELKRKYALMSEEDEE
ncbi:hypothetical protein HDU98_005243, partial [Podochytrium sp. JEL0797]